MSDDPQIEHAVAMEDRSPLDGLKSFTLPKLHRACASCEFGVKEQADLVCRYNPPQSTFLALPGMAPPVQMGGRPQQGIQIQPFCGFPIVRPDQWCGRFTKRG